MINNSKLIEWIKINYPNMVLNESDLSGLDFCDIDKFATWLQADTYHNAMQDAYSQFQDEVSHRGWR